jgi:hypothetical protein
MMIIVRLLTVAVMAILFALAPAIVHAQQLVDPATGSALTTPLPTSPIDGSNSYAPKPSLPTLPKISGGAALTLSAKLVSDGPDITRGMTWRVFGLEPGQDGKLPLVASAQGGTASMDLEPGSYLVHAAFGRAGATKRITVGRTAKVESLVLDAGGLKLDAVATGGMPIPPEQLTFSIYEQDEDARGERALIIRDVTPNTVVRLNAGVYQVVSDYGKVNAVIRSEIRVEAGKLTEAMVEHKAAQVTMKLVREQGGEAIADTSWSVLTDTGDIVKESVGAFSSMVLAEGRYTVIAKNRDRIYQRDIEVESGRNEDFEVLTENAIPAAKPGQEIETPGYE